MQARKIYTDADLTEIGRRLKEAYEEAGYTQTSFERACTFAKGYLTKLLYKDLEAVGLAHMERIEILTGVRLQWIFFGSPPKREAAPVTPLKRAASLAREKGIPEDVIAHVTRRELEDPHSAEWDMEEWYLRFRDSHARALEDQAYRSELRRVSMDRLIQHSATSAEKNAAGSARKKTGSRR